MLKIHYSFLIALIIINTFVIFHFINYDVNGIQNETIIKIKENSSFVTNRTEIEKINNQIVKEPIQNNNILNLSKSDGKPTTNSTNQFLINNESLTSWGTFIASIAAAISAFFSYRTSKLQIEKENKRIREKKYQHYKDLSSKLRPLHIMFREIGNAAINDMEKLKCNSMDMQNFIENIDSNFTGIHLKGDYTNFEKDLKEIEDTTIKLNEKIEDYEKKLILTVRERLKDFSLINQSPNNPMILSFLYRYWLKMCEYHVLSGNIDDFKSEFRGIEIDYGVNFRNHTLDISGNDVCKNFNEECKNQFIKIINNLVRDTQIWENTFLPILNERKIIKEKMENYNNKIDEIIKQIERKEYDKTYSCCLY